MDNKELRIGNYVKTWTHIVEVESVTRYVVHSRKLMLVEPRIVEKEGFCFLEPIPITEEWLAKFGFKMFYGWDDEVIYIKGEVELVECSSYYEYDLTFKIEYIHQLQNLYYALTNEELKLNNYD